MQDKRVLLFFTQCERFFVIRIELGEMIRQLACKVSSVVFIAVAEQFATEERPVVGQCITNDELIGGKPKQYRH